jgi:hypothetical protein
MTTPDNMQKEMRLRPTLVIGLGGSGYQVAVQLKARLVEAFGNEAGYDDVVKFMVLDTANENFKAPQPNYPERDSVGLSAGREFVRISDVPLQELMANRNKMIGERRLTGVYKHLPKTLRSSHIDQGAQQIRRLGRIALFHRYQDVKERMSIVIRDLLKMRDTRTRGDVDLKVDQRQRLRVYIVCSICGGTGSGTFIDMAYITRYIAETQNLPPQNVDVVGMLMLPEAFPNVSTTGADRIRANACAALLDLEYYNQDTINDDTIYYEDFGVEQVPGRSRPFNICYLIGGSNSASLTVDGVKELAPMLADSIFTMISSRVGEQLDATLDNIKVVTTQYHEDGHRRLYSGIGISKLYYPRQWLQQRFIKAFKRWMIESYVLPDDVDQTRAKESVKIWFDNLRQNLASNMNRSVSDVIQPLVQLEQNLDLIDNPQRRLRRAFRQAESSFQKDYIDTLQQQSTSSQGNIRADLRNKIQAEINNTFRVDHNPDEPTAGLIWTRQWLDALDEAIHEWVNDDSRERLPIDFDPVINRAEGKVQEITNIVAFLQTRQRRQVVARESDSLRRFFEEEAKTRVIDAVLAAIFRDFLPYVQEMRQQVNEAVSFWEDLLLATAQVSERPITTASTLSVMDDRELDTYIQEKMAQAQQDNITAQFQRRLLEAGRNASLNAIALSLNKRHHAALERILDDLSNRQYARISSETIGQLIERIPDNARKEKLEELQLRGAPLLRYEEGSMSAAPPPEFRVVGIRSREEESEILEQDIQAGDVSYVSTNESSQVTYLHTQHGIPLSSLQNYNIYYEQYRRFARQPESILHLSNELERAPYNPASVYFINRNSLRLFFIRSLAYGWVQYDRESGAFIYNATFKYKLQVAIHRHITNLKNQFTQGDGFTEQGDRLNQLEVDYMTALADFWSKSKAVYPLLVLQPANYENAAQRDTRGEPVLYEDERTPIMPAITLRMALGSLVNSPLQTFARVFEDAFSELHTEEFSGDVGISRESDALRDFLRGFGGDYVDEDSTDVRFRGDAFYLISGNPSDTDLQQRLLLQLAAYEMTETRIRRQLTEVPYYWK